MVFRLVLVFLHHINNIVPECAKKMTFSYFNSKMKLKYMFETK